METLRGEQESVNKEENANSLGQLSFLVQTNPLLINTVLRSLFGFVDYETLKDCRLVCCQWKEISDWMFINQSAFARYNTDADLGVPDTSTESLVDIPSLFQSINQENQEVRFSAYKFQLKDLTPPVREMYLEPFKTTMTHLEITCQSNMPHQNADHLIGPNLVQLKLDTNGYHVRHVWEVSVKKLLPIRQIELTTCNLIPKDGEKIAPKVLKLDNCNWQIGQERPNLAVVGDFPISNFVDFHSLEKLDVSSPTICYNDWSISCPILNFSDCVNVTSIRLKKLIINLDAQICPKELILESNFCKINGSNVDTGLLTSFLSPATRIKRFKLKDNGERFDFQKVLSIDELKISCFDKFLHKGAEVVTNVKKMSLNINACLPFDLSRLPIPKTIEVLKLTDDRSGNYQFCQKPIVFPQLKQLSLGRGCASWLRDFKGCPKLVHVSLKNAFYQKLETLNVDLLPPNIKSLSLEKIFETEVIGDRKLELEVLVLNSPGISDIEIDATIPFFKKLSRKLHNVELVVFHRSSFLKFDEKDIAKIVGLKHEMSQGSIGFGPVRIASKIRFCVPLLTKSQNTIYLKVLEDWELVI